MTKHRNPRKKVGYKYEDLYRKISEAGLERLDSLVWQRNRYRLRIKNPENGKEYRVVLSATREQFNLFDELITKWISHL